MFFLTRSAVCIGVVAVLAAGGGRTGIGRVFDGGGREAVQDLGRACMASSGCLRLGTAGLVASMGGTGPAKNGMATPRSHDTLTISDLSPPWAGPSRRRSDLAPHPHPGALARL